MAGTKKPRVHVFTLVYGEAFVDKLCNYSLPSLFQAGNIPALLDRFDVKIRLYTMADSHVYLDKSIKHAIARLYPDQPALRNWALSLFSIKARDIVGKTADLARADPAAHESALSQKWQGFCLLEEIKACLADDAIMILSSAELLFGNHSLFNLVHTVDTHSASVAALCLRVDENALAGAMAGQAWPLENARLATLALESLHRSTARLIRGGRRDFSIFYGTEIVPLTPRLFSVTYGVPSVFATRFQRTDAALFRFYADLRPWDSAWTKKLIAERRFMCLGSSDLGFCVDITPASRGLHKHIPALYDEVAEFLTPGEHPSLHLSHQADVMRNFSVCLRTDRDVTLVPNS
jgi:hypothetical protein